MATAIEDLNLTIPPAELNDDSVHEQQRVLIENFILLHDYLIELEARVAVLEALHP